ncbi:MAG: cytochrome c family protein [Verrucomicrobia bacterium]|nr:cytochrome c family protein [Verrucomicrobiota bacterium]
MRTTTCLLIGLLAGIQSLAAALANFETRLFSGAGNCAFCHDPWNESRAGQPEEAAVLASDWRATMMAHSFKDPLWRAVMEAEVKERPELKSFITNKCQTCHAPTARSQAHSDGTNELSFAAAVASPLATEGVGCTLCHQIQAGNLGTPASFTGHFVIGTNRHIFGPYEDVLTMPMQRHVNYTPLFAAQVQDTALCATCHTLFAPILDEAGKMVGEFPEQVPYLEWQNSDYARRGKHCQDCHMPRTDEPVKVSARPPWLDPRAPFWKHQFVGGNVFMLQLLADNAKRLDAKATARQFEPMIEKARAQLRQAARLHVKGEREGGDVVLRVEVENLAGHKFPTGHPYRRAWLHVRVTDTRKHTLFESGAVDKAGTIRGVPDGYTPHRDIITQPEEVQIYQSVMADANGQPTWSLWRGATYFKDNRLPPRGFAATGANEANVAVCGEAELDANFNAQSGGRDEVTYRIALPESKGTLSVEVELLYQSVPPEAVARLLNADESAALVFARMYRRQKNRPELVHRQHLDL